MSAGGQSLPYGRTRLSAICKGWIFAYVSAIQPKWPVCLATAVAARRPQSPDNIKRSLNRSDPALSTPHLPGKGMAMQNGSTSV